MPNSEEIPQWFAMRATYRRELKAKSLLEAASLVTFIPMKYAPAKENKNKRQLVPAISNLIFVNATPSRLQQVKAKIPFLQYMIDARSREKVTVPHSQMKQFIAISGTCHEQLLYFTPQELDLAKGARVRISGGEFKGHEGVFVKVKGARDRRVVVQIQGIVAVAMATIHPDFIEPICS